MRDVDMRNYFEYLRGRGRWGLRYRRWYLYPNLSRYLHGTVLDIGCGIGDFIDYRANSVGVDTNTYNVEYCRGLGYDVHLIEKSRYPFGDATFDSGIMDNVLEHIVAPLPALSEAHRVLRQGATLVVGVPGWRGYKADPDHKVFYDEPTLLNTLADAGFESQRVVHMPLRSGLLNRHLSQYCLYGIFARR